MVRDRKERFLWLTKSISEYCLSIVRQMSLMFEPLCSILATILQRIYYFVPEESVLRLVRLRRQVGGRQMSRSGCLRFGFVLEGSGVPSLQFLDLERLFHQDFGEVLLGFDF
jgi:hypothetical protein